MKIVSIIIPHYNGKELLHNCINSIYQNISIENFEIIVVDNGSKDESVKNIRQLFSDVIIISNKENVGYSGGCNIGAKNAEGKYLIFLNNDTVVTENFISEMINAIITDKKIAICQSLLLKPNGDIDSSGDFLDDLGVVYNSKTKIDHIREISSARGASMLIRANIFEKLHGFDEKFFVSFEIE